MNAKILAQLNDAHTHPTNLGTGGIVKAKGLGDGLSHGKSAIAKLRRLRLTLPPAMSCNFAIAPAPQTPGLAAKARNAIMEP